MTQRRYRLPSLNGLKIFEAVMRHGSIRKAAEELCISPQAVSHQIKLLESSLALPLFLRQVRGVTPTAEALRLVEAVRHGLDHIAGAITRLAPASEAKKLWLHVSPYFASAYLIPHLADFTRQYPDIDVRISIGVESVDLHRDDIDAAILWRYRRHEQDIPAGCTALALMDDLKVIACSPALLARKPVSVASDLLQHTLIAPLIENTLWDDTLALLGLPDKQTPSLMHLHTHDAMREGALAGLGVGLISWRDALSAIREGRLIAPFGLDVLRALPAGRMPKFELIQHDDRPPSVILARFIDWLSATVKAQNAIDSQTYAVEGVLPAAPLRSSQNA